MKSAILEQRALRDSEESGFGKKGSAYRGQSKKLGYVIKSSVEKRVYEVTYQLTVGTSATLILPANFNRVSLFIQNTGVNAVRISSANLPLNGVGINIPSAGHIQRDQNVGVNEIYAIAIIGSTTIVITEGTLR